MSSAGRLFAQRSSALRTLTRQAVPARPQYASPVGRRGYASAHGNAQKSSDLPWLISAVVITVPTVAYLTANGPKRSASHGPKSGAEHEEKETSKSDDSSEEQPQDDSKSKGEGESKEEDKSVRKGGADPFSPGKRSQSGHNVPPPAADNSDLATNWEERKERKQEFDALVRAGETRVASSSSTAPSKRTAGEDPREDPKKGEGEAVKRSGPSQ
ncbi:hypothetical protein HD806DRAFT_145426 [Xylariaceae sp. AK1471]|nr:hypothetical protein HD806DRAFT_145426 [Xylariaceae sp. AK1471]